MPWVASAEGFDFRIGKGSGQRADVVEGFSWTP